MLLLVADELIIALEDKQALLALVVAACSLGEPPALFVGSSSSWRLINGRLVLIDLPCLLPGVLEPDNDDPRAQSKELGKIFQVVILGVGVVFKELLEDFDLVVREPGAIGSLSRKHGLRADGSAVLIG